LFRALHVFYIFSFNFNETEQERLRREKDKSDIASNAIKLVLTCCAKRVASFNAALLNAKPKYEFIRFSNGNQINSLGLARLNIIKLISKMISFNDAKLNQELIKQGTLKIIIVI
jgi:hypothetical protein